MGKKKLTTTQKALSSAGIVVTIGSLAAGAAFAYFTSSGSGAGELANAATSSPIRITDDLADKTFGPGQSIDYKVFMINSADYVQQIAGVKTRIIEVVDANGNNVMNSCSPENFRFDGFRPEGGIILQPGRAAAVTTKAQMVETGTNQDACKGVRVRVGYTAISESSPTVSPSATYTPVPRPSAGSVDEIGATPLS